MHKVMLMLCTHLAGCHVGNRSVSLDGFQLIQTPVQLLESFLSHFTVHIVWKMEGTNCQRTKQAPPSELCLRTVYTLHPRLIIIITTIANNYFLPVIFRSGLFWDPYKK